MNVINNNTILKLRVEYSSLYPKGFSTLYPTFNEWLCECYGFYITSFRYNHNAEIDIINQNKKLLFNLKYPSK